MDFTGKTAFVTGASVGIGKATAQVFAQHHANLVLADLDLDRAGQRRRQKPYTDLRRREWYW